MSALLLETLDQLCTFTSPETKSIFPLPDVSIQYILCPHGPISQSCFSFFALWHADSSATCLEYLLHHQVAYITWRVGYDAVLGQGLFCPLENTRLMPRWMDRSRTDTFSTRIATQTFCTNTFFSTKKKVVKCQQRYHQCKRKSCSIKCFYMEELTYLHSSIKLQSWNSSSPTDPVLGQKMPWTRSSQYDLSSCVAFQEEIRESAQSAR